MAGRLSCLVVNDDDIPLCNLREQLALPDSLRFDDLVNFDKELEASESVTEDSIRAELMLSKRVDEVEEEDTELDDEMAEMTLVCSQLMKCF